MKRKAIRIIVLAMAVASGAVAWQWHHRINEEARAPEGGAHLSPSKRPPAVASRTASVSNARQGKPAGPVQGDAPADGPPPWRTSETGVAVPLDRSTAAADLPEQELRRRAAKVEQEANHDLKHLVGLLGLDEGQQDRIFDTLVRHSPEWHPAMQPVVGVGVPGSASGGVFPPGTVAGPDPAAPIGSSATAGTGTLLDAIAEDLSPDQQTELANAELDRQEWWESIVAQLLPGSDIPQVDSASSGTTAGGGDSAAAAPPQAGPVEVKSGEEPAVLAE